VIYAVRHQDVILLLISLDVVIEGLPASDHRPKTTQLPTEDEKNAPMEYSLAVPTVKEECPDPKFSA
jgi:hypothetical protein